VAAKGAVDFTRVGKCSTYFVSAWQKLATSNATGRRGGAGATPERPGGKAHPAAAGAENQRLRPPSQTGD